MEKKTKKVGGVAAATAAVAGAAVAAGAVIMGNETSEELAQGEPVGADDNLVDGEVLPELEVVGNAPTLDGGTLAGVEIRGHAHETVAEAESAESESHEELAEAQHVAEPLHVAEAHPVAEPAPIAEPEPISAAEEEDYDDFEDVEISTNDMSMRESNLFKDLSDALRRAGEEAGIIDKEETESLPDFINDADTSEFTR